MRSRPDQQRPRGRFNDNKPSQQPRVPERDHARDSNGPNIKIRGNPHQIFERYIALAREAAIEGDRVAVENFYQHAEHYFRISNPSRDSNPEEALQPITSAAIKPGSTGTDMGVPQPRWDDDRRDDGML